MGRKQLREVHVEGGARGSSDVASLGNRQLLLLLLLVVLLLLVHLVNRLGVDGRDVPAARVPVSKAADVRSESAVGEARVAV